MNLADYWSKLLRTDLGWVHPDDEAVLARTKVSFNFDFPPPAFVGDVLRAKVIVLVANGGYDPIVTAREFSKVGSVERYIDRLNHPDTASWWEVAPYYDSVNYGHLLTSGKVALVNACAYRSRKISEESENKRAIKSLPSAVFTRSWLLEQVLPQVRSGDRMIVGKRHGLWSLPNDVRNCSGFVADPAPVSPHLSGTVFQRISEFVS